MILHMICDYEQAHQVFQTTISMVPVATAATGHASRRMLDAAAMGGAAEAGRHLLSTHAVSAEPMAGPTYITGTATSAQHGTYTRGTWVLDGTYDVSVPSTYLMSSFLQLPSGPLAFLSSSGPLVLPPSSPVVLSSTLLLLCPVSFFLSSRLVSPHFSPYMHYALCICRLVVDTVVDNTKGTLIASWSDFLLLLSSNDRQSIAAL